MVMNGVTNLGREKCQSKCN